MDYLSGDRRKTKNDKKAKRRFRIYKQGGKYRGTDTQSVSSSSK